MPKVEILRNAICYIEALEKILNNSEPSTSSDTKLQEDDILSSNCVSNKVWFSYDSSFTFTLIKLYYKIFWIVQLLFILFSFLRLPKNLIAGEILIFYRKPGILVQLMKIEISTVIQIKMVGILLLKQFPNA